MGWQEQQAAYRAQEQQRQAFQNQQARQRDDSRRAENDAANRRARDVREAGYARANARADSQRQANSAADQARYHRQAMNNAAQAGKGFWGFYSASKAKSGSSQAIDYSYADTTKLKKKSGSGTTLVVFAVIGFIIYANSDSHKSTNNQQTSAATYPPPMTVPIPDRQVQRHDPPQYIPPQAARPPQQWAQSQPPSARPIRQPASADFPAPGPGADRPPQRGFEKTLPPQVLPPLRVLSRVAPQFPQIARQEGMRGTVTVAVWVSSNGAVVNSRAENGNPVLAQAALYAARQWRFNPYAAQAGDPLRTTTINFKFGED